MIPQATDFCEESEALYRLLEPLEDKDFQQITQFKDWTINDVISHLHLWNLAADMSLCDPDAFDAFLLELIEDISSIGLRGFEDKKLNGLKNRALLREWHQFYREMSKRFEAADPKTRVKWAGPDMSVRSSISARLMETWAHGQEIYDNLGVVRENKDRIKNIAVLGMKTFDWTYINRGLAVPETRPYVKLTAPSGETWEWNDSASDNIIEGAAEEFCQVVTQCRSIEDTNLRVTGEIAVHWMSIAQCFAGPPEDPPKKGTRFTVKK